MANATAGNADMKRGAPVGYYRYQHWPRIQNALAARPTTVRALADALGMNRETLAGHLLRMRAHGRAHVQREAHGNIGAVWAARRTT